MRSRDPAYSVRIEIDRFEIEDDQDPWILGPGEVAFTVEVERDRDEGRTSKTRLPNHGTYRMTADSKVVNRTVYDAELPAEAALTLRCAGIESDLIDDDEFVRYERQFTGTPAEWAGEYGPADESKDVEARRDWRLWYTIDVEPVTARYDDIEEGEKFRRREAFFRDQFGDIDGNIPLDVWERNVELKRSANPPTPIDDDPGGPAPEGGKAELLDTDATVERTKPPVDTSGMDAVDIHVAVDGPDSLSGTLRIGLEPEMVHHVTPSTLRLFRFDEPTEQWQLVHRSGLGNAGDYLWAHVTKPGVYGVFGLPRDRASRATMEMMVAARQAEPMRALMGLGSGKPEICKYIMCQNPTVMSGTLDNPALLEREGLGDYIDEPMLLYGSDMTDFPVDEKGKPAGMPDGYTPVDRGDEIDFEGMPGIRGRGRGGGMDYCMGCLGGGGGAGGGVGGRLGGPGGDIHDDIDNGVGAGGRGRTPERVSCERWKSVGPDNISGRMTDLAYHPTNGDVVYASGAGGGVWKSTDGGQTWRPTMLGELTLVIGAIGLSSSNSDVLYAATGEYLPRGYIAGANHAGDGVYKTTDGGKDWDLMSRDGFSNNRCSQVLVDPTNPDRVYVSGRGGVHRWDESREQWNRILWGDVTDIAMHPNDPTELIAAIERSAALQRTTNARAQNPTWNDYDSGITAPDNTKNFGKVAYAPSNPSVIYAIVNDERQNSDGEWKHDGATVYRRNGSSWNDKGSPIGSTQEFWCSTIAVGPDDSSNVIVGGVSVYETQDGGDSWSKRKRGHADIQSAAFDPTDPQKALIANDGGVFSRNTATGNRDFSSANQKLTTAQFYNVSVSQTSSFRIGGSTQDQSILTSTDGSTYSGLPGNEGGLFQIDPNDEDTIYWDPWNKKLQKTEDGTGSGARDAVNGISGGSVDALAVKPGDSDVLVCANDAEDDDGNDVYPIYRSTDGAANPPGTGWQTVLDDAGDEVSRLEYAPSNTDVVYAITEDGDVWRSDDEGRNWTETDANDLPNRELAGLAVDHQDPDTLFVTLKKASWNDERVWKSTDGGDSFFDIAGVESHTDLPKLSFRNVIQHPTERETLWVQTPVGIFITRDGGDWWYSFDQGLPNAWISGMAFSEPQEALYVSTIGYGMWKRSV